MGTSVPTPSFGTTGFIAPSEADILAGVQGDINSAFGGDLNPALNTPQGQLASSQTAIIGNVNDTFLYFANQVDPAFAQGRMQDAIARIYFIERNPSQPTVVPCVCTGLSGVVIPENSKAIDAYGNIYVSTQAGTIEPTGSVTIIFANLIPGPIACPAGSLTQVYQIIPGWDTIVNPSDGVLGNNVESRAAFEERRRLSVAQNSVGSLPSVLGAVLNVDNVIDAFVMENATNSAASIGSVVLAPNSIYVAVVGGDATAVARAIWSRKAPGCSYNGNTAVIIQDTSPTYVPPYPTYTVLYEIPMPLQIIFAVSILNGPLVPSDGVTQIQNAIIAAMAGEDGGPRGKIGTELLASRFYAPIAALGTWAQIVSLEIGSTNASAAVAAGSIAANTLTVTQLYSGALAIGQTLVDVTGSIVAGTVITALGTGTGGVGTYTVSAPQTVGLELITAVATVAFKVAVNLNQVPSVTAANISVALSS